MPGARFWICWGEFAVTSHGSLLLPVTQLFRNSGCVQGSGVSLILARVGRGGRIVSVARVRT